MSELADLVIVLDDQMYAQYKVKFLFVGTLANVTNYFAKAKNMESVGNRLTEIDKVTGLTKVNVKELVKKGVVEHLKIEMNEREISSLADHVYKITISITQRVHEYCECLAYEIEDNGWKFDSDLQKNADIAWLKQGLRQAYNVVESCMNSKETKIARRNQVLFVLGKIQRHNFNISKVEALVKEEFPETITGENLGIGDVLNKLVKEQSPIINKSEQAGWFEFNDPRYLMAIRVMLRKNPVSQRVEKKGFLVT